MIKARSNLLKKSSVSIRYFSTLLKKSPESLTTTDLTHPCINQQDEQGRLKLIESILQSQHPDKSSLYNYLIPNFSYYFKLPKSLIQQEVLHRLINVNPGRVHGTFDLFNLHRDLIEEYMVDDILRKIIQENVKLEQQQLEGESEEEGVDLENIINIVRDYKHLQFDKVLIDLLYKFINNQDYKSINSFINENLLNIDSQILILNELVTGGENSLSSSTVEKFTFLELFHHIYNESPTQLTPKHYTIALNLLNLNYTELQAICNKTNQLSFPEFTKQLLQTIESSKLDILPESIILRQTILETLGIGLNDTDSALKKYHHYETHAKTGIEIIRFEMIKISTYQAIIQSNATWKQIAQSFIPPELTIETLQVLIILEGYFDINIALEIYNDYINAVSAKINDITKKSSKGLLTESIILAFLMNNDRGFASLVFDKSVENGILSDELEISQLKKVFKKYSDCFVESEVWENEAELRMKDVALKYLIGIGGVKYS